MNRKVTIVEEGCLVQASRAYWSKSSPAKSHSEVGSSDCGLDGEGSESGPALVDSYVVLCCETRPRTAIDKGEWTLTTITSGDA